MPPLEYSSLPLDFISPLISCRTPCQSFIVAREHGGRCFLLETPNYPSGKGERVEKGMQRPVLFHIQYQGSDIVKDDH